MSHDYSEDEEQLSLTNTLKRFASTKGAGALKTPKVDKRTETSKANMAKARAAKLEALRKKREEEENEYEIEESDSEESDSDGEELIIKKRKPQKGGRGGRAPPAAASDSRIERIEMLLAQLAQQQKRKKPVKKTVIQVGGAQPVAAPAAPVHNPKADALKRNLLGF